MLRRIITLISVGLIASASADEAAKLDKIQKKLDDIMAKAGISFSGEFQSQYMTSRISGEGVDSSGRTTEPTEYTSVDFDINARPNQMISGRALFRMHQNWQNFFGDVANPIFTRWLSIDGNVADMFSFNVGDFKKKYSPLTLYTPEIDIMFEPYIFARLRQNAMDEKFLGENNRVLQGLNIAFDAQVEPIFDEFHFSLIGSRLRTVNVAIQNGSKVANEIQALETKVDMTKYFVSSNFDMTFLKGIDLGLSYLYIFDHKGSYRGSDTIADTLAQHTSIFSFRPGVDIARMLGNDALTLNLSAEIATSADDSTWIEDDTIRNSNDSITSIEDKVTPKWVTDAAMIFGGEIGFSPSDAFGLKIGGSFIMNGKNYKNELAQSPSFIGDRMLNNENDGLDWTQYNTFDALYHNVFKFCPIVDTIYWVKAPYEKISYTKSIFEQLELTDAVAGNMDPAVQLVMPFGLATPNRVGINLDLTASFLKGGIEAKGLLVSMNEKTGEEVDSTLTLAKAKFSQVGGGLKLDFGKIASLKYPIEISGSYVMSSKKRDILDSLKYIYDPFASYNSGFLNLGMYVKFFKPLAFIGGVQMITNDFNDTLINNYNYSNWSAGVEWRVSDGAALVFTLGQMGVNVIDADSLNTKQNILDLSLRVRF